MKKYTSKVKSVDYYDIGNGLKLMNILTKNEGGKPERIDSYIGTEIEGFSHVGVVQDLSQPGTIFSYSGYVRMMEYNLDMYLRIYEGNTRRC